jgi:mannosyltransferase
MAGSLTGDLAANVEIPAGLPSMQQLAEAAPPSIAERKPDAAHSERLWIVTAGAVVVFQLWFGMIATSFWLDETGTWWIVKDGAAETVRRALFWSGQSPLFYLIEWCSSRLFGLNEVALRIPSVLAMAGAGCFLYRIAERLYGRAGAAAAAFVFLCAASFYAIDARPYALAMLCLTASTWALLRWLDGNRPLDATLYVITAALVVYAHCIMSLGVAAGVIYAAVTLWNEPRRLAWLGTLHAAVALLCLPLVSELRTFYAARSAHTFTAAPGLDGLLPGLIPCSLAGALILLVWIVMMFRGEAEIAGVCSRRAALLIGMWSLFAPVFLFLLAVSTDLRLYVPKYYSSALPAQALLAGFLLSSIRRSAVRKALIVVVGAVSIPTSGRLASSSHGNEDWRAAMAFVKKEAGSAPVLLVSGFVEASDFAALHEPKLRDILFAPELFYGEPERSIRLPNVFNGRGNKNMDDIASQLQSESRFFLVTENPDRSYEMWLLGRLRPGCRSETTGPRFGYLWIARFTCF